MSTERLVTVRHFFGVEIAGGELVAEEAISEPVEMTLEKFHALATEAGSEVPPMEKLAEIVASLDYDVLVMHIKTADRSDQYNVWVAPSDSLTLVGITEGKLPDKSEPGLLSLSPDKDTLH